MEKRVYGLIMMSALLLSIVPQVVRAADGVQTTPDSTANQTTVKVNVSENKNPMKPVEPDNPDKLAQNVPENGANPGSGLSLVYVTSRIRFKDLETTPTNNKANEVAIDEGSSDTVLWNGKFVIEVGDERGTGSGWHLTVTGSPLKSSDNNRTMNGAEIKLPEGTITRPTGTTNGVRQGDQSIVLKSTGSNILTTADDDTGAGMTTFQMAPDKIMLSVPVSSVRVGNDYTTKLNWTLSTGPSEAPLNTNQK